MTENIYEVLEWIRENPQLYLTKKSIGALANFVSGYRSGFGCNRSQTNSESPPFGHFPEWLERHFGRISAGKQYGEFPTSPRNSFTILSEVYPNSEEAFHKFFVLLDDFRQRRPQIIATVDLPDDVTLQAVRYVPDSGIHLLRFRKTMPALGFTYFETMAGLKKYATRVFGAQPDAWKVNDSELGKE